MTNQRLIQSRIRLHTKKIGSYELVMVIPRGFNYGAEWASNFTIELTGDHEGFLKSALSRSRLCRIAAIVEYSEFCQTKAIF